MGHAFRAGILPPWPLLGLFLESVDLPDDNPSGQCALSVKDKLNVEMVFPRGVNITSSPTVFEVMRVDAISLCDGDKASACLQVYHILWNLVRALLKFS